MPCLKRKGGWKIGRKKGKGTYPKLYKTKSACEKRVQQMHAHKK